MNRVPSLSAPSRWFPWPTAWGAALTGSAVRLYGSVLLLGLLAIELAVGVAVARFESVATWVVATVLAVIVLAFTLVMPMRVGLTLPTLVLLLGLAILGTDEVQSGIAVIPLFGGSLKLEDVLILLVFAIWLSGQLVRREPIIVHSPVTLPLVLLVLWAALSVVMASYNGADPKLSVSYFRPMIAYVLFFVVATTVKTRQQVFALVAAVLTFSALFAALFDVFLLVGEPLWVPFYKIFGAGEGFVTMRSSHSFAGIATLLALSLFLFARSPRVRVLLFVTMLLSASEAVLLLKRSVWLATLVGLIVIWLELPRGTKGPFARWVGVGLLGVALLILVLDVLSEVPLILALQDRFTQSGLGEPSLLYRFDEDQEVLRQFLSAPILGVGLGMSHQVYDFYLGTVVVGFAHNTYLFILSRTGLIGFAIFLWFAIASLQRGLRLFQRTAGVERGLALGVVVSVVFLLVASNFEFWLWVQKYLIFLAVVLGLIEPMLAMTGVSGIEAEKAEAALLPSAVSPRGA
ncbi:MAG: O-antigen ligase family protein [Chloroflexi bacterium]|nr:O-antigen ligase family protein [Chloroflexota bacterium]